MTDLEAPGVEEPPPPYIIFVVVFLFFLTGLLGFLICHLLKKKGYRCRTGDVDYEEDEEEGKLGGNAEENEENQDTVEQILKCIIENEANMEAFDEMLKNHNVCMRHDPRARKESIAGIPSHHHTVHSGTDHNSCHLCAQVRSKKGRRQSRTPRFKQRPGEQTVFSVGRFRVTHHDKKLHGGPNPMTGSGDQLDQSQDSDERKESGYNLRNMFKDVRLPPGGSNGVAPNVGKRRKSVTIFGLRQGSDPAGIKVGEGTGREIEGVRFAIQQQPVVLEELSKTENMGNISKHGTQPGIKPETKPSNSSQCETKTLGSANSPSSNKTQDAIPSTKVGNKDGPSRDTCENPMIKSSIENTTAPSSLPIPSPISSVHAGKTAEKTGDVADVVTKDKEAYDPGPLQISTPIVCHTLQPEGESKTGFSVTQTLPDSCSSQDLETGLGARRALIILSSSPPSSGEINNLSSVSLLKTSTSRLSVTPSPKLSLRDLPPEATKTVFSIAITSPSYPSDHAMPNQAPVLFSSLGESTSPLQAQSPSPTLTADSKLYTMPALSQTNSLTPLDHNLSIGGSPNLTLKSESMSAMNKGDKVSSPLSATKQEPERARISKTEVKRVEIVKTPKLSPVEVDTKTFTSSSPNDQPCTDRLRNLPLSPSSHIGSRVSNVTIVKASPNSKLEFSVVTMVEEESPSSTKAQQRESSEPQKVKLSPTDLDITQPESRHGVYSESQDRSTLSQHKDEMVEMEDIKDCKVTQIEKVKIMDDL